MSNKLDKLDKLDKFDKMIDGIVETSKKHPFIFGIISLLLFVGVATAVYLTLMPLILLTLSLVFTSTHIILGLLAFVFTAAVFTGVALGLTFGLSALITYIADKTMAGKFKNTEESNAMASHGHENVSDSQNPNKGLTLEQILSTLRSIPKMITGQSGTASNSDSNVASSTHDVKTTYSPELARKMTDNDSFIESICKLM